MSDHLNSLPDQARAIEAPEFYYLFNKGFRRTETRFIYDSRYVDRGIKPGIYVLFHGWDAIIGMRQPDVASPNDTVKNLTFIRCGCLHPRYKPVSAGMEKCIDCGHFRSRVVSRHP